MVGQGKQNTMRTWITSRKPEQGKTPIEQSATPMWTQWKELHQAVLQRLTPASSTGREGWKHHWHWAEIHLFSSSTAWPVLGHGWGSSSPAPNPAQPPVTQPGQVLWDHLQAPLANSYPNAISSSKVLCTGSIARWCGALVGQNSLHFNHLVLHVLKGNTFNLLDFTYQTLNCLT